MPAVTCFIACWVCLQMECDYTAPKHAIKRTSGACGDLCHSLCAESVYRWNGIYTALKHAIKSTCGDLCHKLCHNLCAWSVYRWDIIYTALKQAMKQSFLVPVVTRVVISMLGLEIIVSWTTHTHTLGTHRNVKHIVNLKVKRITVVCFANHIVCISPKNNASNHIRHVTSTTLYIYL